MGRQDVIVDGMNLSDSKMFLVKRINRPIPQRRKKTIEVAGRDGNLTILEDSFEPVDIEMEFNYKVPHGSGEYMMTKIGHILNSLFLSKTNSKLEFCESDNSSLHYKVSSYDCLEVERASESIAKFKVIAHTLDGALYRNSESWVKMDSGKRNSRDVRAISNPILKLTGNGSFTLDVESYKGTAKITGTCEGDMVIDTERMIVYRDSDKKPMNTLLSGDIAMLKLFPYPTPTAITFTDGGSGVTCQLSDNERMM